VYQIFILSAQRTLDQATRIGKFNLKFDNTNNFFADYVHVCSLI